jgi:hypothetical protein
MNKIGLIKILLFNDSRKVGWGLWFHISTELFFIMKLIDLQTWMACKAIVGTMIGGGTLMDKAMENKKVKDHEAISAAPVS